jgi:gamma-glutamyl-gamma-aminobutyrate hydrolase PuuD
MRPAIAISCQRLPVGKVWKLEPALAVVSDYVDAVWRAGGLPVPIFPTGEAVAEAGEVLDSVAGVILIGGFDVDPARYGQPSHDATKAAPVDQEDFEFALLRGALDRALPTLCICRGLQVLNVALGGSLHQHITGAPGLGLHGIPSGGGGADNDYQVVPDSLLAEVMGTNGPSGRCHHHQAVDEVAPGLVVSARTADGTVEALERDSRGGSWLLAVQWHPEETAAADPANQALFDHLVAAAGS